MDKAFPAGAAIVFGGSGGIGKGVAAEFAKAGSNVAICYRSKQDVAEAAAEAVRAHGVQASIHQADVRTRAAVEAAFADAVAAHGRVHTVVWGAGPIVAQVPIADWSDEQFRQSMEIEVFGFFHAVKAALPHFRSSGGGSFVHLGSAGHDWWPHLDGLSVAPKASNEALIKGIAKEEGVHEIRANSILVGVIDAGQFKVGQAEGYFDEAWESAVKAMLPIKRWGKAEDIGRTAVFLASDAGNYITGQTISVAGGFGV
ncbi:SDR family NAD(P)-dependent oxidoreductase [Sphingomonas jatrophae]|uniref:NAD(P)-dependent dehydrogenase, short-chain alcohol dehydrogenase family n=1 Tax=Sphingomonas jatrophae TaxID=1166337 RepID=A0A1I6KIM2_9SPHN|nr:SDR family oxidoreductase [Sphingomonas jatrophae]SFR91061.1 NAD(P)-dependent dehydrogenase, short-chain alcohol dehydrogenase family [Sphingomonas jatrophae]